MRYAAELPLADFEDAMQVAAARACGVSAAMAVSGCLLFGKPNINMFH